MTPEMLEKEELVLLENFRKLSNESKKRVLERASSLVEHETFKSFTNTCNDCAHCESTNDFFICDIPGATKSLSDKDMLSADGCKNFCSRR